MQLTINHKPETINQKPYLLVSDFWNQILVPLGKPKFVKWSEERIAHFKSRCEADQIRDLGWWLDLIEKIPKHDAAMAGSWFDLEWLIKSENNLIKFIEGKYEKAFADLGKAKPVDQLAGTDYGEMRGTL